MAEPIQNRNMGGTNVDEFTAGTVELPRKSYGGNPADIAELLMEYKRMTDAHGYSDWIT